MSKYLIILLTIILLAACGTTGNKQIMQAKVTDQVVIGETTLEQVRGLYGEPQRQGVEQGARNYTVWRYAAATRRLNPACFVPGLDLAAGKMTTTVKAVDFYFDQAGVLQDLRVLADTRENRMPIGTLTGLVAVAGAAASMNSCYYNPYYYGGRGYGYNKAVIRSYNTGTSSYTTIKWYK